MITVQLEIAAAEAGMGAELDQVLAKSLGHVGLAGPDTVPCVAVRWQIAQKLHACTEVPTVGQNDRFRDLIDLQLLAGLVDERRWADVRAACIAVFEGRAKHAWPRALAIPEHWHAGYRALTRETGLPVVEVEDAGEVVRQFVVRIDAAK